MRLVIFGVIGLVVGLGGGVGFSMATGGGDSSTDGAQEVVSDTVPEVSVDSTEATQIATADTTAADSLEATTTDETATRGIASSLIRTSPRDSSSGVRADSTTPGEGGDSAAPDSTTSDVTGGDAENAVDSGVADSSAIAEPEQTVATVPTPTDSAGYRRVSRILAAMDADEAAQVLGGLQDSEVRLLITLLPARTAAAILAELDPARVARLSRAIFKPTGSF